VVRALLLAKGALVGGLVLLVVFLATVVGVAGERICAPAEVAAGGPDEADLSPIEVAVRVHEVGRAMGVPDKHILAAFATVVVEAGGNVTMSNPMCYRPGECDRDSVGAFQQRDFSPWTDHGRNRRNVRDAARTFYEQARLKDRPSLTPGQLAQAVQVSAFPDKYDLVLDVAASFLGQVAALPPTRYAALASGGALATGFVTVPATGGQRSEHGLIWPTVAGTSIGSGFGMRWGRLHAGVDIPAASGSPVYAAAAGVVTRRDVNYGPTSYGNYTCLRHGAFTTCYAHMLEAPPRPVGASVAQGAVIGQVGNTGHSFGAHLHFELRLGSDPGGEPVDPASYLDGATPPTTPTVTTAGCGLPSEPSFGPLDGRAA
jgi:murein DD-endopeptidase MepM/ murein hydrolase activator NlpD